jgi:Protein of unknown function (DUF2934)
LSFIVPPEAPFQGPLGPPHRAGFSPKLQKRKSKMARPAGIEIVRRAYELWEQAGKPEGRDQEFYHQAERELQEALSKTSDDSREG